MGEIEIPFDEPWVEEVWCNYVHQYADGAKRDSKLASKCVNFADEMVAHMVLRFPRTKVEPRIGVRQ